MEEAKTVENGEQLKLVLDALKTGGQVDQLTTPQGKVSYILLPELVLDQEVGEAIVAHPRCWRSGWGTNDEGTIVHWRWQKERRLY